MMFEDFKYALRLLAKKPGFTALTALVMAVGLGLSIYLFSFFHTIIFKDLPFEQGDTLVQISTSLDGIKNAGAINLHDYAEIRGNVTGLEDWGAYRATNFNVSGRDGARRYSGIEAEPNIFALTRTRPILGREFSTTENDRNAEPVVLISHKMWQNYFAGDGNVVDSIIRINGDPHRVIGVMPEGYVFPFEADLWRPLRETANGTSRAEAGSVQGLAHLAKGASLAEVNEQMALIMQRLEQRYPDTNKGIGAYASSIPLADEGGSLPFIYSVMVIAVLVLVLAAINVGNLLLSRAVERSKETAVRVALGAPRSRLIMQIMWESIIICAAGGIVGFLILAWGLDATTSITKTFFVDNPPFWWTFGINRFNLTLFTVFIVASIIITGLLPAWRNSGADFNTVLRDGTRGALGKKAGRMNRLLITSEIFVSLTVLIAACVMIVGNYKSARADYGADTDGVLTAEVMLPDSDYDTAAKKAQFVEVLQNRLRSNQTIDDAAIASALPGSYTEMPSIAVEGREYNEQAGYPRANYVVISPGSLEMLGVSLRQGRYFDVTDDNPQTSSAIVTESFAEREFPNESPIGKRIRNAEADGDSPRWLTIVGVVEHTIQGAAYTDNGKAPTVFQPYAQAPRNSMMVAVKMRAEMSDVVQSLRSTLASIDSDLPAFRIEQYANSFKRHTGPTLFMTTIIMLFGIAAILLALSGIYGVMSNSIAQRTQEIGIKRAFGAVDMRIIKEFFLQAVKLLAWGGIPGLLVGCGLGFAMSQMLLVDNDDLFVIALLLAGMIVATVLLATYIPTKRALNIEPTQALRYE